MTPSLSEWANDKGLKGLVKLLLLIAVVALGVYAYATYQESQIVYPGQNTISVSGEGEAIAVPDIASFSFSVETEAKDATSAQNESAEKSNAIKQYLMDEGIKETDIKTIAYNLYPKYEYQRAVCTNGGFCPPGKQVQVGFTVNETVSVKVRETEKAGDLISGAGERGATNISGVSFTIDDEDALKAEARKKAIEDAQGKAKELAKDLGVRLGRVVGFWEEGGDYYPIMETRAMSLDMAEGGIGGGIAPSISTGENTIISRVNITYEIR